MLLGRERRRPHCKAEEEVRQLTNRYILRFLSVVCA